MKQLWIAVVVLVVIFAAALVNNCVLHKFTQSLAATLTQAEELARKGDIDGAVKKTEEAQKRWDKNTGYLYAVLRHTESDTVEILFKQTLEYLKNKDSTGEYMASNAALIAQVKLLHEMEELSFKNVL